MASARFRPHRLAGLVLASFLAVVASGCATAPSGGAPQRLQRQSGQQAAFAEPLPPPKPNPDWSAQQVVLGFLAASADFKLDPAAARQYLVPSVKWYPPGSAGITVVSSVPEVTPVQPPSRVQGVTAEKVTVRGQQIAFLSNTGQYNYQPGNPTYVFGLVKHNGVWLIRTPPPHDPLLLTEASFEQVFQPRNLYFWDLSWKFLVPDPVFAPLEGPTAANATTLARTLVQGLLPHVNSSWLSNATQTAFPTGMSLPPDGVTINNLTAVVDLQATTAISPSVLDKMYAQLSETLTSNSYVHSVVAHVHLAINGKLRHVSRGTARVPAVGSPAESLYFAAGGLISTLPGNVTKAGEVSQPVQLTDRPSITAVAVSRSLPPHLAVAVRNENGCAVLVGLAGKKSGYTSYTLSAKGGACTSLSWDSSNNVWAVAGSRMWNLQLQPHSERRQVRQVTLPSSTGINPSGLRVLALRMGPDGVRAAFLVHTPRGGNRLLLAAVGYGPKGSSNPVTLGEPVPVGTSLSDPTAIAWYNQDDLLALDGTELYEVPLTGGAAQPLGAVPGPVVSITSSGHALAVRTKAGQIYTLPVSGGGSWALIQAGSTPAEAGPAYPG